MVRSRAHTEPGIKGIYAVISGNERATTATVTVDAQGGESRSREPLTRGAGGARLRFAPPAPAPAAAGAPAGGRAGGGAAGGGRGGRAERWWQVGAGGSAPLKPRRSRRCSRPPAPTGFRPTDWNQVEVLVDADVFRTNVNSRNGSLAAQAIDGATGTFGPIALHVAGTGEVRFKDLALKRIFNRRITPTEQYVSSRFRGAAVRGLLPRVVGCGRRLQSRRRARRDHREPLLPWTGLHRVARAVCRARTYNPSKEYGPAMVNFAFDYTGDGWDDVLVAESRTPVLYVNPKGEARRWTRYQVFPATVDVRIDHVQGRERRRQT